MDRNAGAFKMTKALRTPEERFQNLPGYSFLPHYLSAPQRWIPQLSKEEAAAFPSQDFKAGVRMFPNLVPDRTEALGAEISKKALHWWKEEWQGISFMAIGMQDPILGPTVMKWMKELESVGHFVQEQSGELVAKKALEVFSRAVI